MSAIASPGKAGIDRQVWTLLCVLAAIPAVIAVAQLGRIHPDELFQTLEPALYRARGYGVLAWEWHQGVRNWALPLLFSYLIRLCDRLGIRDPQACRAVLEVPQYLLHLAMLLSVFRYAERRAGRTGALWATLAVGLYGPILVFAGRTLGESFSTALLVISLERLDRPEQTRRDGWVAGLLVGAALVTRYGSAVFAAALILWLAITRRWRQLLWTTIGLAVVLVALGTLDWATWGHPFHSFVAYSRFNLFSGEAAAQFGSAPPSYYLSILALAAPLWLWPAIAAMLRRERYRLPPWLFLSVVYLAALARTPHKEQRFLYPALALLVVGAAPEIVRLLQAIRRPDLRQSLAPLIWMLSLGTFFLPTELQAERGDQFRAIVKASRPEGVTGLLIVNEGLWGSGGYFYIGKNIPWLICDQPSDPAFQLAVRDRRFNRAVCYDDRTVRELEAAGFRTIEKVGHATILARAPR